MCVLGLPMPDPCRECLPSLRTSLWTSPYLAWGVVQPTPSFTQTCQSGAPLMIRTALFRCCKAGTMSDSRASPAPHSAFIRSAPPVMWPVPAHCCGQNPAAEATFGWQATLARSAYGLHPHDTPRLPGCDRFWCHVVPWGCRSASVETL